MSTLINVKKGFDFGIRLRTMAVTDIDFNGYLREANIIGCGYAFEKISNYSNRIPCITILAEHESGLRKAFECFKKWGYESDGDSVEIHILLKDDGTYELWINPETERALYRSIPKHDIYDAICMNISFVKKMDSTNEFLPTLIKYLDSLFSPVLIRVATCDTKNLTFSGIKELSDIKPILKFDLKVIHEKDSNDPRFKKDRAKESPDQIPEELSADSICKHRKILLDLLFPVTIERIKSSSIFEVVRSIEHFNTVSEIQITQAIINLQISDELNSSDKHFSALSNENYTDEIWRYLSDRMEMANGKNDISKFDPKEICEQLRLDILKTFEIQKISHPQHFAELQALFRELGYIND